MANLLWKSYIKTIQNIERSLEAKERISVSETIFSKRCRFLLKNVRIKATSECLAYAKTSVYGCIFRKNMWKQNMKI